MRAYREAKDWQDRTAERVVRGMKRQKGASGVSRR